jgi:hypothetical protein
MKFRSDLIAELFVNKQDHIKNTIRSMSPKEKIVISQGFGLQEKSLPLRFPSYVVGTMRLLNQLPSSCTVDMYIALHGVFRANGSNATILRNRATQAVEVLGRYIHHFHRAAAHQVRIQIDAGYEPGSRLHDFILSLLPTADTIVKADDGGMASFVAIHGGLPALIYMIEHALYMRDPILGGEEFAGALLRDATTNMDHTIVIGGPAERIFHRFRQALLQQIGRHARWQSHQFFVRVGDPPTYHKLPDEPEWGASALPDCAVELLQNAVHIKTANGFTTTILRDLTVMLLDCGGTADFKALTNIENTIKTGKSLSRSTEDLLQLGWEQLLRLQKD